MTLSENRVLRTLAILLQIVVAGVFYFAATLKALDPQAFAEQIREYDLLPQLATFAAWSFIIVEFLLATALLVHLNARVVPLLSIGLLLVFVGVIVYAMLTGVTSNCGCFGNLVKRTPEQTLVEDVLMIVGLLFAYMVLRTERPKVVKWKLGATVLGGIVAATLTTFAYHLPVDGIVTQLRVGQRFTTWPTEGLYRDLAHDTHLVFLFSVKEQGIESDVAMMNAIAQREEIPSTVGLIVDGAGELTTLMFQYGTSFHVGALEHRFARTLYRTLPRAFLLHENTAVAVWSRIPTPQEVINELSRLGLLKNA